MANDKFSLNINKIGKEASVNMEARINFAFTVIEELEKVKNHLLNQLPAEAQAIWVLNQLKEALK